MDVVGLYQDFFGLKPAEVIKLPQSGSHRAYFRLWGKSLEKDVDTEEAAANASVIGVEGESREENAAFCAFARHFKSNGINVPEIYAVSEDGMCYLQEDLGSESLFDHLAEARAKGIYTQEDRQLLKNTIRQLARCQRVEGLNYDLCIEEKEFSHRGIIFDLHYFKYCFLKASGVVYNEYRLEDDFEKLAEDLLKAEPKGFLYRDFQARNVMIHNGEPYFIDFQSGRKGPVHYDLASFVYQARSNYPDELKRELIETYKDELSCCLDNMDGLISTFVLFRTLQVLAAYGFRGNFERKAHFIESIPFAIRNLEKCLDTCTKYPYLKEILEQLVTKYTNSAKPAKGLTVEVASFSYKKGIPADNSGNGGGYVFDCRGHNNPGRYAEYKNLTGLDEPVRKFLRENSDIDSWLDSIYEIVDPHVETFLERGFNHLQVSFGCTGGHHRSVYSAEAFARHIKSKYPEVKVLISHPESGVAQHEYE